MTDAIGGTLLGHHPEALPPEVIAEDAGRQILRYSTDSPLRTTTGDLDAMPAFAGHSAAVIDDLPTAADRIGAIMAEAEAALVRLDALGARDDRPLRYSARYASPPCLAHEIDPAYFDPLAVDPQQTRDVARWRRAERERLLVARRALNVAERESVTARSGRWRGALTWPEPLVTVLHGGYLFVPLGALGLGAEILAPGTFGMAVAQHLWMAGALGQMTLAVMTRAALGHAGRLLHATAPIAALYVLLVVSVVARLLAGALPDAVWVLHLSATAWMLAWGGFAVIYWSILTRPKAVPKRPSGPPAQA